METLISTAAAAERLHATPAAVEAALIMLRLQTTDAAHGRCITPLQVMQLNENIRRRVPSELAGQLIDDAYMQNIALGKEVAQALDGWINPPPHIPPFVLAQ